MDYSLKDYPILKKRKSVMPQATEEAPSPVLSRNFKNTFKIYRANKNGTGFAAEFKLSDVTRDDNVSKALFLTLAPQAGTEKSFDWRDKGITAKLNENDIGEVLAVLSGRQDNINGGKGLYHSSPKGVKTITFSKGETKGFYLKLSGSDIDKKPLGNYYVNLSDGDAEVLRILLQESIVSMYQW